MNGVQSFLYQSLMESPITPRTGRIVDDERTRCAECVVLTLRAVALSIAVRRRGGHSNITP